MDKKNPRRCSAIMKNGCELLVIVAFGGLSGFYWFSTTHVMGCEVKTIKPCFTYHHCRSSPEGIRDLDCFWELKVNKMCVWKSDRLPATKASYTLFIEQVREKQRHYCQIYKNILATSKEVEFYIRPNLSAYVVDLSDNGSNCTKAVFCGGQNLTRCSPKNVNFTRHARQLKIWAFWNQEEVKQYVVQIRESLSLSWRKLEPVSREHPSIASNLTSSASYEIQVQCVINTDCLQCPWSNVFTVPPELTEEPMIMTVIQQEKGKRLVTMRWKHKQEDSVERYVVNMTKGREFSQTIEMLQSIMSLVISGSTYNISVRAANKAGTSPSTTKIIPPIEDNDLPLQLNVTFSNTFVVSWNNSLTQSYICFSVEWWLRGQKPSYQPFLVKKEARVTIKAEAPWQPYRKYVILLHARPNKDSCNLKSINNSEITLGRAEAYAAEGTPTSAPVNVTCSEVTSTSLVVQWHPVPEDHLRGHLLGYTIYYRENSNANQSLVNVSNRENTYMLSNLKEETMYTVEMSASTSAGEGVRSQLLYLKTKAPDTWKWKRALPGTAIGIPVLLVGLVLSIGVKRAKKIFWPSIPNPGNSNAIQKIDGADTVDVLEPINKRLAQVRESDACSLHIIERQADLPLGRRNAQLAEDTAELCQVPASAEDEGQEASGGVEPTSVPNVTPRAPCPNGYTTMELFHQRIAERPLGGMAPASQSGEVGRTKAMQDYIRQEACQSILLYCKTSNTDVTIV